MKIYSLDLIIEKIIYNLMSKNGILTVIILVTAGISIIHFSDFENDKDLLGDLTSPIFERAGDVSQSVDGLNPKKEEGQTENSVNNEQIANNFNDLKNNLAREFDWAKNRASLSYKEKGEEVIEAGNNTKENVTDLIESLTGQVQRRYERILIDEVCKDLED